jgi:TolB-like protein/tetratricopeptide (TPR) repeat protein
MSEEHQPDARLWAELRRHPAFQTAIVFAGASWLLLQAADIFGLETSTVRFLGVLLVAIFLLLVGYSLLSIMRRSSTGLPTHRLRTRTVAVATGVLLLLGTGAWFARPYVVPPVRAGADVIAVLPFSATGPNVELLGEGLVDLLSANLNEVGPIRAINPRTTLHQYNQLAQNGSIDLAGQLRVGRNVGAGSVVVGSVVSTGNEVRITAELYSVETGGMIAKAQKSGHPDGVLALVDQLSVELMHDIWRARAPMPELRVSAITTQSVPAIRAYLRGERHYRRVQWDSAQTAFEDAVAHDSTFALAHFRLGEVYGWRESLGSQKAQEHSQRAAQHSDRLPARERTLVVAHQLHEQGRPEAIDSLRAYVARFPDDIAGQYFLADARFHASLLLATPSDELLGAFERLVERDPSFAPAYAHLLELTAIVGDSAKFDRYMTAYEALVPDEAPAYAVVGDVRWGERTAALAVISEATRSAGPRQQIINRVMTATSLRGFSSNVDLDLVFAAIDTLARAFADNPQIATMAEQSRVGLLGTAGRVGDAERAVEPLRAQSTDQAINASIGLIVSGLAPAHTFVQEREALQKAAAKNPVAAYWQALLSLMQEDHATAQRHVAAMSGDSTRRAFLTPAHTAALNGWIRAARGDTLAGINEMKRALLQIGYAPTAYGPTGPLRVQLARLQVSQPSTRAEGIRRLEVLSRHDHGMLPLVLVPLAEAYIAEGRQEEARAAYARFISLWQNADPELQPQRDHALHALQRLGGDRGRT